MYLCHDCGELVKEEEVCLNAQKLTDPLCQLCYIDLLEGRHEAGPVGKFYPKTEDERLLNEIFGRKDDRKYRKGSSQANIAWAGNRQKGDLHVV